MLDDGEIERRVRLVRPMENHSIALNRMAESHWIDTDSERFAAAWRAEFAQVPEFTESTIHIVAGLLLPIWKRLPNESTRVYRLQTDAGERIIGRRVSPAWVASALAADAPALTPENAFAAPMEGRTIDVLAAGEGIETMLSLRCVLPSLPMVAALSACHLAAILLPITLRRLYIARDADRAGDTAVATLTGCAETAGIEAITLSPRLGDFNEDLRVLGIEALRAAVRIQLASQDVVRFMLGSTAGTG